MHASPPSFLSFSQNTKMMIKYRSGGVNFPALSLGPRSAPSPFPSLFPSPPQSTSCKTSKSWEAVAGEGVANGWMGSPRITSYTHTHTHSNSVGGGPLPLRKRAEEEEEEEVFQFDGGGGGGAGRNFSSFLPVFAPRIEDLRGR